MDMDVDMDYGSGSGHGGYHFGNYSNGYAQPSHADTQWTPIQQYPSQNACGTYGNAGHLGYQTPTPPTQQQAITGVTVVIDTNVLLDYLVVIQKFVADIEKTELPGVVVVPNAVLSELDWQKNAKKNISWSARAAGRWILDKLKEDKQPKVLRVQGSSEVEEGLDSNHLQPDRNTENDISIRDCCRYFRHKTSNTVFLLSGDINLSIRGESDDIRTLEPRKDWSSHVIASSIFGSDACQGFELDRYVQSQIRQVRTSAHVHSSTGAVVVDRMDIDIEQSTEWVPSHVLDDLHLQLVDHFTILLKELLGRIDPSVANNGASSSMHAGWVPQGPLEEWTAADCLGRLGNLRRIPGRESQIVRLEAFMSNPHCRDANARGRRRGQDWTRVQWDTALRKLESLGKVFEDQAIGESVDLLKIAVEDYFRLPTT